MSEPDKATDYHDRGVQAVYSVLIEIGQVLGAWRDKFVIVGGAVPWLLLGHARPQHVGTLDIDIDLDPDALADGEYATLPLSSGTRTTSARRRFAGSWRIRTLLAK
jgi:hypothetical protein